jgi:hypothetical protein
MPTVDVYVQMDPPNSGAILTLIRFDGPLVTGWPDVTEIHVTKSREELEKLFPNYHGEQDAAGVWAFHAKLDIDIADDLIRSVR